ncbi:MAG: hypothetical protein AB7I36_20700 [Rhodospirillaceae bacterium]
MTHRAKLLTLMLASGACLAAPVLAAETVTSPVQNRAIAYVMTSEYKAIWDTPDGKLECPNGINDGPREQFKVLYPDSKKWTILESQLERESQVWFPTMSQERTSFYESEAKIAFGLDLDGKTDANDYTDPDGNKGIDNGTQRAWGCVANYRSSSYNLGAMNEWRKEDYNIIVIELTDVDDLVNDPDVTLTTYRGMDRPMTDATGGTYLPGGTQRIDMRWGKMFHQTFKAKIENGVLRSQGADYLMPSASGRGPADLLYRNAQWRLALTPDRAQGILAGFMDVEMWNETSNRQRSTHHQAYGQASTPSIYRLMRKNADGYPDPKTGENTAISTAMKVGLTQVFVIHEDTTVAAAGSAAGTVGSRD